MAIVINSTTGEIDLDATTPAIYEVTYTVDGVRIVSKMPLELFRGCLVRHFNIRFQKHDISWLKRYELRLVN